MSNLTRAMMMGAAGAASGPTYVDDVFSTYVWEGNSTAGRNIVNGVNLAGEGGLVWTKQRDGVRNHYLYDTENSGYALSSDLNSAKVSASNRLTAFNNNGFTLGSDSDVNQTSSDYASWTFRKQKGFFDIVTYTGDGSANRTINHSLGSVPGMVILKNTTRAASWWVWVSDSITNLEGQLNEPDSFDSQVIGTVNSTTFQALYTGQTASNRTGDNYVAYLFASDDAQFGTDEDESIIKCGSYTGNGGSASSTNDINLGFEPQWILIKSSSNNTQDWMIADTIRGSFAPGSSYDNMNYLRPNKDQAESGTKGVEPTSTGFKVRGAFGNTNGNTQTYIYMAIRRSHKPPEAATEVFAMDTGSTSSATPTFDSGFVVDAAIEDNYFHARLTGAKSMFTYLGDRGEQNDALSTWDSNLGWAKSYNSSTLSYMFKRAPGFMDVVAYSGTVTGNSDSQTVAHNLGVTPELMLVKRRSGASDWYVYSNALTTPLTQKLTLNEAGGESSTSNAWGTSSSPTAPNANNFTVGYATGTGFISAGDFVAYLFATLPGVSKVGTYSGNTSNAINVDCGFTNGVRFVMIKRTNGTGDWYYWDTFNGIVSGNDSYNRFNLSPSRVTGTDYIDPLSTGFTVTSSAPAALNASGGNYLFLAIA